MYVVVFTASFCIYPKYSEVFPEQSVNEDQTTPIGIKENGYIFLGGNCLNKGSKFFPFRVDPWSEGIWFDVQKS